MAAKETRTKMFKLYLNDAEATLLERVASERGLNRSSLLRMLVADERRRLFGKPIDSQKEA